MEKITDDETMTNNVSTPTGTPQKMVTPTPEKSESETQGMSGGRRKSRKVNPALKSWVKFVKKIQHEEKISYPEAMKAASKRKSEWKRGGGADGEDDVADTTGSTDTGSTDTTAPPAATSTEGQGEEEGASMGGSRRRRRSRKQRGGNVDDFDGNWSKQYGQAAGSRKRRRGSRKSRKSRRHRR